jgi:3-oxoacyl-[acyl-carrier-protein] synthase-1
MASRDLAITGVAASTTVGAGADATFAAMRASVARLRELDPSPLRDAAGEPLRVVTSAVAGLDEAVGARLAALVREALADLAAGATRDAEAAFAAGFPLAGARLDECALYLGLGPDDRPGAYATASFEATDVAERTLGLATGSARVFHAGHAAALRALEEAARDVERGAVTRAIVGGVDSLVHPEQLAALEAAGRLASGDRAGGFVPGEAAAFVLVEAMEAARARGARVLARLGLPATETEPVLLGAGQPTDAVGLVAAARRALASVPAPPGERPVLVLTDANGEPYRSQELGCVLVRAVAATGATHRMLRPSDTLGDVGAASAAIAVAFAAHALATGRARADRALVLASSDDGLRGAVALGAPEPAR